MRFLRRILNQGPKLTSIDPKSLIADDLARIVEDVHFGNMQLDGSSILRDKHDREFRVDNKFQYMTDDDQEARSILFPDDVYRTTQNGFLTLIISDKRHFLPDGDTAQRDLMHEARSIQSALTNFGMEKFYIYMSEFNDEEAKRFGGRYFFQILVPPEEMDKLESFNELLAQALQDRNRSENAARGA